MDDLGVFGVVELRGWSFMDGAVVMRFCAGWEALLEGFSNRKGTAMETTEDHKHPKQNVVAL